MHGRTDAALTGNSRRGRYDSRNREHGTAGQRFRHISMSAITLHGNPSPTD
jgi:hypothetical protein